MSDSIKLPTVNDYHHNMIKIGVLETIIFDLERTSDPAVTETKRKCWLDNAKNAIAKSQEIADRLRAFEPADRYIDNVEEIVARQEIWAKYWEDTLEAEVLMEVFNHKKLSYNESVVANGGEVGEDLSLD